MCVQFEVRSQEINVRVILINMAKIVFLYICVYIPKYTTALLKKMLMKRGGNHSRSSEEILEIKLNVMGRIGLDFLLT